MRKDKRKRGVKLTPEQQLSLQQTEAALEKLLAAKAKLSAEELAQIEALSSC